MTAAGDAVMQAEHGLTVLTENSTDDTNMPAPAHHEDAGSCEFCAASAKLAFLEVNLAADGLQVLKGRWLSFTVGWPGELKVPSRMPYFTAGVSLKLSFDPPPRSIES